MIGGHADALRQFARLAGTLTELGQAVLEGRLTAVEDTRRGEVPAWRVVVEPRPEQS